ncbi:FKBP-type peptidyl-prolyl cis-trans isomerase [Streptomyces glomeratus]|uniref:FKBP-type peptidyl-prolyl cis-trans isomerase n=1 Tax=Streptomyces glomeratus TaxID=284452 RepID=UPI003CD0802A
MGHGNVIPGWDHALTGRRVGSRILAVIPAKLAYGPHPPKGLQPDTTVSSVLDIPAAVQVEPAPAVHRLVSAHPGDRQVDTKAARCAP